MSADDYLSPDPDQGFPADLDTSSSMAGNRPASGARRATPGEVLSQGFQGAQNAGDFLGLDVEFTGHQDPAQFAGASPLDLVSPPGTYADDGSQAPYVPEPAPMPDSDPVQDFAQAPSAFEFGEDLGDEGGNAFEAEAAPSKVPLFMGAVLVAGLVGAGVFFGPDLYSKYFGDATQVATRVAPTARTAPSPLPTSSEGGASADAKGPEATPAPTAVASETVPDPSASEPPKITEPAPRQRPTPPVAKGDEVVTPAPTETPAPSGAATAGTSTPSSTPRPRALSFPNLSGAEYQWASEDQLELIWRGNEVPLEAVQAPAKTLMPRVGDVRVFTTSGDVFEGRLYAVGQNHVWIDAQPGRIGLDGERVERIEVLPPSEGGPSVASLNQENMTGGKRVRVRVPGGLLYGHVLKADGGDVILVPDGGGRVRVKAGDVQELGSGRAVVVGR